MENENIKKIKKSCKAVIIISRILFIISIVLAAICFVVGLLLVVSKLFVAPQFVSPDLYDSVFVPKIKFGGLISWSFDNITDPIIGIIAMFMSATIIMVVVAVVFGIIIKAFKTIVRENTPFAEECLKSLKSLFITIVVLTLLFSGLGEALFSGFVFLFLYRIFEYGYELQKLSDETL